MRRVLLLLVITLPTFAGKIQDDAKATRELVKIVTKIKLAQEEMTAFYARQIKRCAPLSVSLDSTNGTVTCVAPPPAQVPVSAEKK